MQTHTNPMLAKQQQPTLQLAGHDMSPIEAGGEMLSRRERRRRDSQISAAAASQLNTLQPKHAPLSVHPCTYPNSTVGVCRTARMLQMIDGGIAKVCSCLLHVSAHPPGSLAGAKPHRWFLSLSFCTSSAQLISLCAPPQHARM